MDNRAVTTTKAPRADATLVAAVDEAALALREFAGDAFGEHCGVLVEDERVVTHLFAATHPGYQGWRWAVTIARAPRHKHVTIDEITLVQGEESLVAPPWIPWKERVDKADLGPGDLVPVDENDIRLVPAYLTGDQPAELLDAREVRDVVYELGLGRERVLSVEGRDRAAIRWADGERGPDAAMAQSAPGRCRTCGFMIRVAGPMSSAFGICANADAPADGQVVMLEYGCGAHSDVRPEPSEHQPVTISPVLDTLTVDAWLDADLEITTR